METMKTIEKRDYIHSHLHRIAEPAIDELYNKMVAFLNESLLSGSEDDIREGNLTSHFELKQEIHTWRLR
jgi:hypothetical protein